MKRHLIQRMNEALFAPEDANLSEKESEIATRLRDAFTVWLDKPMMSDSEIRDRLMNEYGISKTQAYRDLANVKILLGNVKAAGKEWFRFKANSILDQAYKAADEGEHKLAKSLVLIANALVKVNRLDVDEGEQIPWEETIPQPFEPTTDPLAIGIKPIDNLRERIAELKKKYIDDITVDVNYEDVNEGRGKEEDLFQ